MKFNVMIVDGVVDTVMSDEPDFDVEVEIIDYDKMKGSHDLLFNEYEEENMSDIPFKLKTCEDEDEEPEEMYDEDPYNDYDQEDLYDDVDEY